MKLENYLEYLTSWIQQTVTSTGAKGVIVGLSGGIDSAVVACLAQRAFPNNHLAVMLPCHSQAADFTYANELIQTKNLIATTVDLATTYDCLVASLGDATVANHRLALANIKPRLRMTTLYALGQAHNYLVLGTDNADEWFTGYFTKHGDGGVDLLPLVHLLKTEVRTAAALLGVPTSIIQRPPTAGLWEGQTDETEMGFSYETLDRYLLGQPVDEKVKQRIEHLHAVSEHKRHGALQPEQPFSQIINQ